MIFENETTIMFSILIEPNDNYSADFELEDNPYIYKILRSYNDGLTWSHLATMRASDLEEAHDMVDLLNIGAQKNAQKNNLTNIFGSKIKDISKKYPHSHLDGLDYYVKYKNEIDSVIDQSIDPKDDGIR